MNAEELRAMTAQGPAIIMADRESMLHLLDERVDLIARNGVLERRVRSACLIAAISTSLILWWIVTRLLKMAGVL